MNKEFEKLYLDWDQNTAFMSVGNFENEWWYKLVEWSKEHKKEAVESIAEMLKEEPSFVVYILDDLFDHSLTYEGYIPLDYYCNVWIALIEFYNNGETDTTNTKVFSITKDYYKEWREYEEYMKDHYISWNPFHEDDPNITLEEFKQGKRNDEELLRKAKDKMAQLQDMDN